MRVFVVCMDGSCKGVFVLIQKECPSVECRVSDPRDGCIFGKRWILGRVHRMQANVLDISSISANVMGICSIPTASQMESNEPFFRDCFDNAGKLVTWISRKQNPFTRFKMITQLIKDKKISCGGAMLKSV